MLLRVLHLEDDPDYAEFVRALFEDEGIEAAFTVTQNGPAFEKALATGQFDLILADHQLPDYDSADALSVVRHTCPRTPFIILSGAITEKQAMESLKRGATDYILKTQPERLIPSIGSTLRELAIRTERERIHAELSRRDRQHRALTENALDIVAILDVEGRISYVNPSVHRVLGYSQAEVADKHVFGFVHADDVEEVRKAFREVISGKQLIATLDLRALHADGSWRYLEAIAQNRLKDPEILGVVVNARDITDRKQAEVKLRETAQQYRLIFDGNPIPIWVFDHETLAFLEVNDAAVQKYGYSREEFLRMKIGDIRALDDQPPMLEYLHKLVGSERVASMDLAGTWRHRNKDGNVFDVEIKWSPVSFRGRPAFLTMAIDITERKRREHRDLAISNLGQRLSSATSPADAAQIIREVATDLLSWDTFNLDLYDQSTGSVQALLAVDTGPDGSKFEVGAADALVHADQLAKTIFERGAQLVNRDEPAGGTDLLARVSGGSRPSESLMCVPVRSGSHGIGLLSVHSYTPRAYTPQDLSLLQTLADHCGGALERIHAETALHESELLFHSVWENSLDGMRLTDADGRTVAVNDAFCSLVGMARSELQGQLFTIVYAGQGEPEKFLQNYKFEFASRRSAPPQEMAVVLRNGNSVVLDERSSFVERPGRPPLMLTMVRDVTAQRRLEDQFRQAQKMEAIGQLAGGVAHDFNNILTVIHGHASLLVGNPNLNANAEKSATQIMQAAARAASLTRQLLTFSRRQVMQPRLLDLNEVVGNMTSMLGRILGEDIALQLHYSTEEVRVEADAGMLEQVLLNLAVNSRDAMPRGGVLSIRIAHQEVSPAEALRFPEAKSGSFVCLSVADSGCGISPENLRRIFEPFFTTKEVGKGTGLGLATVYGIVKQHQGWIAVESHIGRGTQFRVYLQPSAKPPAKPEEPAQQAQVRGGNETVLVVEDEAALRQLVCQLLAEHGYRVLEADSGVRAIELWKKSRQEIDLVLTDLVMPDRINGRELAERLWADRPELKVIFTSGYSAEVVGKDFVLRSGQFYLQKPYHPKQLAMIVRDCLDSATRPPAAKAVRSA